MKTGMLPSPDVVEFPGGAHGESNVGDNVREQRPGYLQ